MKRNTLLLVLFVTATSALLAQPGTKPKSKAATQVQPMQGGVTNEKLDDLKNPFDTNKVRQVQPAGNNFSWGASNPTSQSQRTRPPGISDQKWRDDSLLWIKNGGKPQADNFSWGESNAGAQSQRTRPPGISDQKWRDDSLLWIKNGGKPQTDNYSFGATQTGSFKQTQGGQTSGKRQHEPGTVINRNPDSLANIRTNTQTQTQGKRQHKPLQKTPAAGNVQANKYANQETNYVKPPAVQTQGTAAGNNTPVRKVKRQR